MIYIYQTECVYVQMPLINANNDVFSEGGSIKLGPGTLGIHGLNTVLIKVILVIV